MGENNLWKNAKLLPIRAGSNITGGFDIGFDEAIPEETKDALMAFVYWVEDRYCLPVTLWVDFKYRHYLMDRDRKRVGYKFYWADFETFPVFENFDDLPVIELPVRTEKNTMDEILLSFTEAISCYFAWLSRLDMHTFKPDETLCEQIFQSYQDAMR